MSNTLAVAEDFSRIKKAAGISCNELLFKNIGDILEYRKKVAHDIINCADDERIKILRNVFEHTGGHLKELLGIS